jgi:hypothetical protein
MDVLIKDSIQIFYINIENHEFRARPGHYEEPERSN